MMEILDLKKIELENSFNKNQEIINDLKQKINALTNQIEALEGEQKKLQGGYNTILSLEKNMEDESETIQP